MLALHFQFVYALQSFSCGLQWIKMSYFHFFPKTYTVTIITINLGSRPTLSPCSHHMDSLHIMVLHSNVILLLCHMEESFILGLIFAIYA